ncbi:MAG: hypothetical protein Q8O14_14495 [bacterium]|nr:hypothetical protein [bacterium]
MALNPQALAELILLRTDQRLSAINAASPGTADQVKVASALALAEAIVEHIQAAAMVMPGIPVATAGSQSAQTGATTGPGMIQ